MARTTSPVPSDTRDPGSGTGAGTDGANAVLVDEMPAAFRTDTSTFVKLSELVLMIMTELTSPGSSVAGEAGPKLNPSVLALASRSAEMGIWVPAANTSKPPAVSETSVNTFTKLATVPG
jgi:hypothetical protein